MDLDDETQPQPNNYFNAFQASNQFQQNQPLTQNQNQQINPNMANIPFQEQNIQSNPFPSLPQLNANQNQNQNLSNDLNKNKINNNTINNNSINNSNNNNTNNRLSSEITKTKLENKFSFWYRISDDIAQYQAPKQALDKKIYETQVKKIHEFDTVEDFWGIFQHLRKPDSCKPGIEFMMFKEPIKPMWEDEYNKNGGTISIKLRKDYTTIIWEEMIFALIGGILPQEMKDEINGIVVTSRKEFNTLQIWFKTFEEKINKDLDQCIRDLLVIPKEVNLEIKQFNKKSEKKSGGYYNNKSYNNYYDDGYEGYEDYKEEKNQYKKNKHHYNKNK